MYINKAFLFGNLTKDPEIRALPSGVKVASFGLATNRTYKDKNGVKQEKADFHNIVVFGKQAELIGQYMKKGSSMFVEGRIETRSWDAPDGQKKYKTEIVVENFQFGPKTGGSSAGGGSYAPKESAPKKETKSEDTAGEIKYPEEEINIEDIPF